MRGVIFLLALFSTLFYKQCAASDLIIDRSSSFVPTQMTSGGIGLIQTPTARMTTQGNMSLNYSDSNEYRFWSINLQLFPWLESTVRYTDVRTRLYSDDSGFSGNQTLKDKGIDVKFRLMEESVYLPEVALGFRDFGGTGAFASEFIGASKNLGKLDFHLGLGWGYLGTSGNTSNPLCKIDEHFCARPDGFSGNGGKVELSHFLKGPAAIFGGLEYQSSWLPMRFKLEYEGNNYVGDFAGNLKQDSRWNIAFNYQYKNYDFSFSLLRGNTLGFSVNYRFNLDTVKQYKADNPLPTFPEVRDNFALEKVNGRRLVNNLYRQSGFLAQTSHASAEQFTVYGTQVAYRDFDDSVQRVTRVLLAELPDTIKTINIVENVNGMPMLETEVEVQGFVDAAFYNQLETDITETYIRQDTSEETLARYNPSKISGFYSNIETYWSQTFGSPEKFYFYQGGVILRAGYTLNKNLSLDSNIQAPLLDNYDDFNFTVDNQETRLPRVRTLIREYISGRNAYLGSLYLHWQDRITKNLYTQAYAGYLETMYAGFGAELLYQPVDSNLAFGFDINWVRQRDFDNYTGLLGYKALTGHANIYWTPKFANDIQLTLNVGQFLAKDRGVNVDIAKKFESGIVVGAYAAVTNVSAEDYGEGSFTKGMYITIPFDLFSIRPSKGAGSIPWAPIARDGGQMLNRPVRLYDMTKVRSIF